MKKFFSFVFIITFFLFLKNSEAQTFERNFSDGKLYIKLKENAKKIKSNKGTITLKDAYFVKAQLKKYAVNKVSLPFYKSKDAKLDLTYLVQFSNYNQINELIKELQNDETIEYVEKSPIYYTKSAIKSTPNDPLYSNLANSWYLTQISALQAWDLTTGSSQILVAVVDDAVQTTHPDLANKIAKGIDVANNDNNPNPPSDDFSHGTHCAGLIAAETNNGVGIASIGYNIKLLAIKAAEDSNPDGISNGYEGILYAADNGAKVISLSWGGPDSYQVLQNTINYAYNKGCVIVAAAGNEALEGNYKSYPACYDHVISVGAVNYDDKFAWFSQYGNDKVDVCAPGGTNSQGLGLLSSVPYYKATYNGNYDLKSGTSMATPITAGLCGLILSINPNLTPEKLETILFETCTNISSLNPSKGTGNGRINAFEAVKEASEQIENFYADFAASPLLVYTEGYVNFSDSSSAGATAWAWQFEGGTPATSTEKNPKIQYLTSGKYKVTLTVSNASKTTSTELKTNYITVLEKGFGTQQNTGFTTASRGIERISIADANTVWALAYDGISPNNAIFDYTRTTDGGQTWQPAVFPSKTGEDFADLFALNADTAWIAVYGNGFGGRIYRTNNAGNNWTQQTTAAFSSIGSFTNTVYFFDKNNGWAMGDPADGYFEIYTTENGGELWTRVPSSNIPINQLNEYGIVKLRDGYGNATAWFSTNKGRVFKTTDKGKTWTVKSTGLTQISEISFANDLNGVVQNNIYNENSQAYTDLKISYTTDGGNTWSTSISAKTKNFYTITKAVKGAPGVFISIGSNLSKEYGSSFSIDYGQTWYEIDNTQYTEVEFYNQDIGWAGGFNASATEGGIFKWSRLFESIFDVQQNETIGIYPNPARDNVHLNAKTAYIGEIITQIYNLTGKLVFQFQENHFGESIYSTSVNVSNLPKGMYVVRMKAGNQIFTNKLVIN
jgi:subtilisin family serine protease/photosystem II stability/assembly factor-like uncharacterized protein